MLREIRVLELGGRDQQETGENYVFRSFEASTPNQIYLGR